MAVAVGKFFSIEGAVALYWEYKGIAKKSPWRSKIRDLSAVVGRSHYFGLTHDLTWKYPKQQVSAETERYFCVSRCNINEKCDFYHLTFATCTLQPLNCSPLPEEKIRLPDPNPPKGGVVQGTSDSSLAKGEICHPIG